MTDDRRRRLDALRSSLDPSLWHEHEPIEIEGQRIELSLRPGDAESLARCVCGLVEHEVPALIRGSGSRMHLGNRPRAVDVLLSTSALSGVEHFEPDDGVVEVGAGTRVEELRDIVAASGWELPLDANGTVGGVIATASLGPRSLAMGPVRRIVLGLDVVLGSGDRTRCGGRVVKNVTGYDLAKLYTGGFGTLGVMASAWLRLAPKPQHLEVRVAEFSESERALAVGLEASRRSSARASALLSPEVARAAGLEHSLAASWLLLAEFAGEQAECLEDARWLESTAGATTPEATGEAAPTCWMDAVRDALAGATASGGVRARIAVRPSALSRALPVLQRGGARMTLLPGLGLVYADLGADLAADSSPAPGEGASADDARVRSAIAVAEQAAREAKGSLLLESLPIELKRERDVFDDCRATQQLARRLKDEFDPHGILNPGRFAGGI